MITEKARINRARRTAARRGLRLSKSQRRDPCAVDFGLFALLDAQTGKAINPPLAGTFVHSWTMIEVEDFFAGQSRSKRK